MPPDEVSVLRRMLARIDRGVMRIEAGLLSLSILLIAVVQVANVLARNLLGLSFSFAEEVSQAASITLTFVGIGYAARLGRHIRMSALSDALPPRARRMLERAMHGATAVLLGALTFHAAAYVADVGAVASVTPALRIPLFVIYGLVPIGLGLGALQYGLAFLRGTPATPSDDGAVG
jgi:TRAP-type C4-dicarboxylate transport system permease small subunit